MPASASDEQAGLKIGLGSPDPHHIPYQEEVIFAEKATQCDMYEASVASSVQVKTCGKPERL
jgi:hypothetical protein